MKFYRKSGTVESIQQLLRNVELLVGTYRFDSVYLRGQADFSWGLRPTISRRLQYAGRIDGYDKDRELYLLNRFRRYLRAALKEEVNERDLLILARHHGIPVRLLDWTTNPLVALYYACADDVKLHKDGAIWAFVRCQHPHGYFYDWYDAKDTPFALKGVKILYAPHVSPRIPAQSCSFTTQDNPDKELQTYDPSSYQPQEFDLERIEKWRVPFGKKARLLLDLERCGISERSLFPDLDGIARGIIRTEVLRKGVTVPPARFWKKWPF